MSDQEKAGLLAEVDDDDVHPDSLHIPENGSDNYIEGTEASSSMVPLSDMGTFKPEKKKRRAKKPVKLNKDGKKKKKKTKQPLPDGVDLLPINPDGLECEGEEEEGYRTYEEITFNLLTQRGG